MKYLPVLLLLFSLTAFSQELETLKHQDTIYLVLPETDGSISKEYKTFTFSGAGNKKYGAQGYTLSEPSGGRQIHLNTQNDTSPYFMKNNITVESRLFFAQHKDAVITLEFINKYGVAAVFFDTLQIKNMGKYKFYVINEASLKDESIVLKATRPISFE
ncbi:hypothetical protein FMM05_20725 [Flavobacterium zepuense]|uniref:Uncharacterized protein n=1 Tax=Flavobacterium zepuense TaxID=2593302 RepID=A0A552US36_9FLAO|nr:hypothetical protein [Flavobacterium zepuense]TRW21041.1 hypothetical protein FMM05_20725 [Flavobacterium zepuense]